MASIVNRTSKNDEETPKPTGNKRSLKKCCFSIKKSLTNRKNPNFYLAYFILVICIIIFVTLLVTIIVSVVNLQSALKTTVSPIITTTKAKNLTNITNSNLYSNATDSTITNQLLDSTLSTTIPTNSTSDIPTTSPETLK